MRALLDTHAFLWFIGGDLRLSSQARGLIEAPENQVFVSIASLWEIAVKTSIGKLELGQPFGVLIPRELERQSISVLGISVRHLATVATLPRHHRDPFDRLIIAQASVDQLPIVGKDSAFKSYDVGQIW